MTATCYYHSDQVAPNSCIQCGVPICNNCRENIAGKTVCKRCAPAFAQRVQASPSMYAAPPAYGAPASPATGQSFAVTTGTNVSVGQRLAGLGVGLVIGIIGAIIWEKIYFYGGFSLSLIYLAIGYGVGLGIAKVTGRAGTGVALEAVLVTALSLLIGHIVYSCDILAKVEAERGMTGISMTPDLFFRMTSHLPPWHWIVAALGLYSAFKAVERSGEG